jgi:hypothetical protein
MTGSKISNQLYDLFREEYRRYERMAVCLVSNPTRLNGRRKRLLGIVEMAQEYKIKFSTKTSAVYHWRKHGVLPRWRKPLTAEGYMIEANKTVGYANDKTNGPRSRYKF